MLDTSTWKEFKIEDIFDVKLPVGDIKVSETIDGDVPFVTATKSRNGVSNFISADETIYTLFKGFSISVDMFGHAFFHEEDFFAASHGHVNVLIPKQGRFSMEMTKKTALFIVTLINNESYRYSFGEAVYSGIAKKLKIRLPVDELGKVNTDMIDDYLNVVDGDVSSIPDYFLSDGYDKACWYLDNIDIEKFENEYAGKKKEKDIKLLDRVWKEFEIGGNKGLFDCSLPNYDLKVSETYSGDVNLITTAKYNNGCGDYVAYGSCDTLPFQGNKITVNMFGYAFYQEKDFYAVGHGHVNILTPKFVMSKYIGLFICSMINNDLYRFSFGRAVYQGIIEDLMVNLPVKCNDDGTPFIDETKKYSVDGYVPDWQFMEDYIKSLPFSCKV